MHRPTQWEDYVGQEKPKKMLDVFLAGAKKRNVALDHVLLYGPPGLGKTTMAKLIADRQGGQFFSINGGSISSAQDIIDLLIQLKDYQHDVIFIDEIHRMPMKVEEVLYEVLEDFKLTKAQEIFNEITFETETKVITYIIPKFTMIGATTIMGNISKPMRDRFRIKVELEPYSINDLSIMALKKSFAFGIDITPGAATEIAVRSRGTARIVVNLVKSAMDVAASMDKELIDEEVTESTFDLMEIDSMGLQKSDYRYLNILGDKPRGVTTIATTLCESASTIETVIEPYLITLGLIERTSRGRILTERGKEYLQQGA